MPSNKDRLYVALYARGGTIPNTYHWALLIGPKKETAEKSGMRFHVKNRVEDGDRPHITWVFEELQIRLLPTKMLLVRMIVAKIQNRGLVERILRSVPIRQTEGWNCVSWVKEELELLTASDEALGTKVMEWNRVRDTIMTYCQRKKMEHRFDGQLGNYDQGKAPTYDLILGKETIR